MAAKDEASNLYQQLSEVNFVTSKHGNSSYKKRSQIVVCQKYRRYYSTLSVISIRYIAC